MTNPELTKIQKLEKDITVLKEGEIKSLKELLGIENQQYENLNLLEKNKNLLEENEKLEFTNELLKSNKKEFLSEIEGINRLRTMKFEVHKYVISYVVLIASIIFAFYVANGILEYKYNNEVKIENNESKETTTDSPR